MNYCIKQAGIFLLLLGFSMILEPVSGQSASPPLKGKNPIILEDFDDGEVTLLSYPGEDLNPNFWELNASVTYNNSPFSLKITGNTWKMEAIQPVTIDSGDVWQVAAYIQSEAEIQGFGIMDANHSLFYSFSGTELLTGEEWVPVYQGSLPRLQWNIYQLPIADDWLAAYGYLPEISHIVYVNDKDATSTGIVYFDYIADITNDLPVRPAVSVSYSIITKGSRNVEIAFTSEINDPDSEEHDYYWDFGDGTTSPEANPVHTYLVSDDHWYTVFLKVKDDTDQWGYARCRIEPGQGNTTLPVTLNFVGDIMLARKYEDPGGIIPTQGVEAIFTPTLPFLGNAADITVANLECPLTDYWVHHPTKAIYFKGSPENVAGLTFAGIDLVTLANNHVYDYLQPGMQETIDVLEEQDIRFSGSGNSSYEAFNPAFISKSGINFSFLATCDRTGQYNNYQPYLNAGYNKPGFANMTGYNIARQIREVRDISDILIMEYHSGVEYSFSPGTNYHSLEGNKFHDDIEDEQYNPRVREPDNWNREIRHLAIDLGADLVICHHPHIIHGVELYHGKLIAHSLGNFTFDLTYPETFPSMILNAEADTSGFTGFTIIPVYIDDFIPKRAKGELGLYILDELTRRSKDLDTYLWVDRDSITASLVMDTLNMLTREIISETELELQYLNGEWVSVPYRIAKNGSISGISQIQPMAFYQYRLGRESLWFGNMEDEGCTMWDLNSSSETYCDTAFYGGLRSVQHNRNESSTTNLVTNLEQKILCLSDTLKYTLCGYIKTLNASNVTIQVRYFEERGDEMPIGEENVGTLVDGTTPWTFYHKTLTIPGGTGFFDIRLNSGVPETGTAFSWFDNISLIAWDSWTDFNPSNPIDSPNDFYYLQLKSNQNPGVVTVNFTQTVFNHQTVSIPEREEEKKVTNQLGNCYPNPFNPLNSSTRFCIEIEETSEVVITVSDITGRQISHVAKKFLTPGVYHFEWTGTDISGHHVKPGVYLISADFGKSCSFKKCMVVY